MRDYSVAVAKSLQTKVQMRDYSFLLPDDTEVPLNSKPQTFSPPKSETARTGKLQEKSEAVTLVSKTSGVPGSKKDGVPTDVAAAATARSPGESAMQKPVVPSKLNLRIRIPVSKQSLLRKGETQESRKPTAVSLISTPTSAMQKPVVPSELNLAASKQCLSRKGEIQESRNPIAASSSPPKSAMKNPAVPSELNLAASRQCLSRNGETQESRNPTAASLRLPPTSAMQKPLVPSELNLAASKQCLSRKGEIQESRKPTAASSLPPESAMKKPAVPSNSHLRIRIRVSKQSLVRKEETQESRKPTAASSRLPPTSAMQNPVVPSKLNPAASKKCLSRKREIEESRKPTAASCLPPKSAMKEPAVPSKLHLSEPKQSSLRKGEILPKQKVPQPPSKPRVTKPLAKSSVSAMAVDDRRPKKRPRSHDDNEEGEDKDYAISEIGKMFGYNCSKYVDDDDSNMEVNFQDILGEEKRSARIAGKEDRVELRKMQEEERRERLQEAKKLKIENEVRKTIADLGLDDDDDDDD